jgi:hypothetical protein
VARAQFRRRNHLRLVEPTREPELPPVLVDPAAQREFEQLTQALVDIAIEITDLIDGDPDFEPSGDEFEESDPLEDGDGL